ncbi:MAG: hypothetical protein Kow0069_22450 [Promethearchaeota archaeon]
MDKIHGSWTGKVVGSAFGMPFEGKDPRWIAQEFGQVAGWQEAHGRGGGVVNDDEQFELAALICMEREGVAGFTLEKVAKCWRELLNRQFLFTAERQVYLNWRKGIPVNEAAEPRNNPFFDFIGGQMKGEIFGQVAPGDLDGAARLARVDGAVAHHGVGVDGEVFVACLVSKAVASDAHSVPNGPALEEDVREALARCDQRGAYVELAEVVLRWWADYPEPRGWKVAFSNLQRWWREEAVPELERAEEEAPTHPGRERLLRGMREQPWVVCHVLPNAGILLLALLYGKGDFSQTMQLAAMMGHDADCNAGNLGGILGAYAGRSHLPAYWADFVNDEIMAVVKDWEDPSLTRLAMRVHALAEVAEPKRGA